MTRLLQIINSVLLFVPLLVPAARGQDDLGVANGFIDLKTDNFQLQLVRDAQVLVSLKTSDGSFDFLPRDYLDHRAQNGQYHWGDVTYRYRKAGTEAWSDGDSAQARKPVTNMKGCGLAAANIGPTLPSGPLTITRQWMDMSGDLALRFKLNNTGQDDIEIGSLGFPTESNSIFTGRQAADMLSVCSLADPYVGMHAGYMRIAPTKGAGPALVVTPLQDSPLEAYRNLQETYDEATAYGSQTFEGLYEWQVLSKAWGDNEWADVQPWNTPSSRVLSPGESLIVGVRFSIAAGGVRDTDKTIRDTGTPTAVGVPGYIIPRGEPAKLFLDAPSTVQDISVDPANSISVEKLAEGSYQVTPSSGAWGRARLTIKYADGKIQTVHYYITKPGSDAIADVGRFLTTEAWFEDTSDPFNRAPSVMTYDHDEGKIVTQDSRAWVAGLSDEGGVGAYLAAAMKQAVQPQLEEVAKIEEFVDKVVWKTIQTPDYAVRKSIFYYEPSIVDYDYSKDIDWTSWTSWNKDAAYATDRAYDYVHVAATYWALYRVARAYPDAVTVRKWDWYIEQAYRTIERGMDPTVGYNRVGLMGETVFGEILTDLTREGMVDEAKNLTESMRSRATQWDGEEVPFGSEMAWDSTGQEGVFYWAKFFGLSDTATKTINSVLGYVPAVPHWGWNGNARRYWDNIYGGKLQRIERQIHHYGSALNALVLLSGFRSTPTDTYLLRAGYGGISGAMSSIHDDGYVAASFHSWPDTLRWDGITGDYGPGFLGMVLGTGTYIVQDPKLGLVAYGGVMSASDGMTRVRTTDPVRQKVFIAPLGLHISIGAGIVQEVNFGAECDGVEITLSQLDGVPKASSTVVWLEDTAKEWEVSGDGVSEARQGWEVSLQNSSVTVRAKPNSC